MNTASTKYLSVASTSIIGILALFTGEAQMLRDYLKAAMNHAHYEILSDDGSFYGEIPVCNGVYSNTKTLESCRDELEEVLEEWVFFRIHKNLSLPVIDGLELKIREAA